MRIEKKSHFPNNPRNSSQRRSPEALGKRCQGMLSKRFLERRRKDLTLQKARVRICSSLKDSNMSYMNLKMVSA